MKDTAIRALRKYYTHQREINKIRKRAFSKQVDLYLLIFIHVHSALSRLQINTSGQILNKPQGTNKSFHAWKLRKLMDQLSLPLFGWQLELLSSHFSTLSKSWSILHLSITLTIWQAKACPFSANLQDHVFAGNPTQSWFVTIASPAGKWGRNRQTFKC